jgi:hypothetical protein
VPGFLPTERGFPAAAAVAARERSADGGGGYTREERRRRLREGGAPVAAVSYMALAVGAVEELATMAREEALATASGGGRGGPGSGRERRAWEWRGDWPDILRSRFSLLIYHR